jgi:hypothetical protein
VKLRCCIGLFTFMVIVIRRMLKSSTRPHR